MSARALLALSASVLLLALPGCIINVDHTEDHSYYDNPAQVGNYAGAIRAAGTISFSTDRCTTLTTIAAKPDIDEPSQLSLIDSLRGSWGNSSDKTKVLQALVGNSALTSRASLHIANHLEQMVSFSGDRKQIADMLASRPAATVSPAPQPPAPPAAPAPPAPVSQ